MSRQVYLHRSRRSVGDLVSTSDLAIWFDRERQSITARLRRAGIEPVAKGRAGVTLWPREAALRALYSTRKQGPRGRVVAETEGE